MPAEPHAPDKLSVVAFSGDYARIHYALSMASAAAAINRPVTVMFTMEATRALLRDGAPDWSAEEAARRDRGVVTLAELFTACDGLGVRFLVCEMGLRVLGLARADLRDAPEIEEGGIVTFLNDASADGAMVVI